MISGGDISQDQPLLVTLLEAVLTTAPCTFALSAVLLKFSYSTQYFQPPTAASELGGGGGGGEGAPTVVGVI